MKYLIAFILGVTPVVAQNLTQEQEVIAMTILGEARGEGEAGMYAVACVLAQRVKNASGDKSYTQICKADWQFSCWNDKKKSEAKLKKLMSNSVSAKYAKRLAIHIDNLDRSYVAFADHYCTLNTNNKWTRKSSPVKVIGQHKFFKLR